MPKSLSSEQPDRFFAEARACLATLRGIPVIALNRLRDDERSRDVIISILREIYMIAEEAELDLGAEIEKQDLRDSAENNLKELLRNDRLISLEELKENGLKLAFSDNGPIVVPA